MVRFVVSCSIVAAAWSHGVIAEVAEARSDLANVLLGTVYGHATSVSGGIQLTVHDLPAQISAACAELALAAPITIDEVTSLERCTVGPDGKTVQFALSLRGIGPHAPGVQSFMETAKPILERAICRNADVPTLGKFGIALTYTYHAGAVPVLHLTIDPGQCGAQVNYAPHE